MNEKMTDTFTVPELYLLAAAFDGKVLFGLPEKEIYQLKGADVFAEAHQQLIDKKIITSEGKLTDGGAIIVQTVELYHQSQKYVRINNLMFAFREQEEDELILLVEIEEQKKYKLLVISKAIVLKMLGENFPIVLREPEEQEKTFLKTELSNEERRGIEQYELDQLMNLEFFHLKEKQRVSSNPSYYQQWFIFEKENKLMMIDTVQKRYYHASQYWFLKLLFDEMEFPYKEAK